MILDEMNFDEMEENHPDAQPMQILLHFEYKNVI